MARRPRTCVAFAVISVAAAATGGCGVGESQLPPDFAACPAAEPVVAPAAPTYYEHAKPILDARCAGCHVEGGLAPFALTTYDEAYRYRFDVEAAVASGHMPPWQPSDCCRPYRWTRSLPPLEKETLLAWTQAGAPPGDPADEGAPIPTDRAALERVDVTLEMPEPYTPVARIGDDEIRCFLLDWPIDEEVFVTGLEVRPGNRALVHHAIVWVVEESEADDLRALDAASDGLGWDCGGFGLDFSPNGSIGGFTPGDTAVTYPGGLGRKVPARSAIVLSLHYDTSAGTSIPDRTAIDVMVERSVEKEIQGFAVGNPQWLVEGGLVIPAGGESMVWFAYDPTTVANRGAPFLVWAVNLHMHEHGTRGSLAILRASGEVECLLDIPAWDFHWMADYWLAEPVELRPGDRLYVECHFANPEDRDLGWGTDEEMCGGILLGSAP